MKNKNKIKLFLVDDDIVYLKSLEIYMHQHTDFSIDTFATGELCMKNIKHNPDMIILDYQLNGIVKNAKNGIDMLDDIKAYNQNIPVAMLSSQDKIEVAVNCMLHNSSDYIVKSETAFMRLQKRNNSIFQFQKMENELSWYMTKL